MDGHNLLKVSQLGSAAKETLPRKMAKANRTVSVGCLFDQVQHPRQRSTKAARDALVPRPIGVSKSFAPKQGYLAQSRKQKKTGHHPSYLQFIEAVKDYQHGVAVSRSKELEPVYEALVSRVDALNVNGQPLDTSNLPSKAELDALIEGDVLLSKSLDDERMTIQNLRKNGITDTKEVKLGDTLSMFQKVVEDKRAELESLLGELKDIDAEVTTAKANIFETEQSEIKRAKTDLNVELESLIDQASAIKDQTLAEIKKARKDEQAVRMEINSKLDDFMKDLF